MGKAIVTLKIMPESPETDLEGLEKGTLELIEGFCGETDTKKEIEPIAFGLKALKITFVMDEDKGSTEELETNIDKLEGVNSVEIVDVRRALG